MPSYSILIVDDEKIVCDMMKLSLEKEGYEVESFLTGNAALDRLKEKKFDVVVTDFKMKGIDGLEVLRTIKQLYPKISVIMITAFANLDVAIEALREDVHDFFPKPIKLKALKKSIRNALH